MRKHGSCGKMLLVGLVVSTWCSACQTDYRLQGDAFVSQIYDSEVIGEELVPLHAEPGLKQMPAPVYSVEAVLKEVPVGTPAPIARSIMEKHGFKYYGDDSDQSTMVFGYKWRTSWLTTWNAGIQLFLKDSAVTGARLNMIGEGM